MGIVGVVVFGTLSGVFLLALGIYHPNRVFIGIVRFSRIVIYIILRYGHFTLTPESAVMNIIRTMPDELILTDLEGRILAHNTTATGIF